MMMLMLLMMMMMMNDELINCIAEGYGGGCQCKSSKNAVFFGSIEE
jgi:hypothetical protein